MRAYISILVFIGALLYSPCQGKVFSPAQQNTFKTLEKKRAGETNAITREVKAMGNRTVRMESFISAEMDLPTAKKILKNYPKYPSWALKNINVHPKAGESYKLLLLGLTPENPDPSIMKLLFKLQIPLFPIEGKLRFKVSTKNYKDHFHISAKVLPAKKSVIEWAVGNLKISPLSGQTDRVWIHMLGNVKLKSGLLYEVLPIKLFNKLLEYRMRTVLKNYLEEQDRLQETELASVK